MKNPRDEAIATIVRKYKSHPLVEQAIQNQKTGSYQSKGGDADLVADFLGEAGTYALLTAEDEKKLFSYIDKGYRLYEELGTDQFLNLSPEQEEIFIKLAAAQQVVYHANLRLAIKEAKFMMGFRGLHLQAVDHIQEAYVGLFKGISHFDVSRGYKFSTYATQWIQQSIKRSIGNTSRTIRLPVHKHQKFITTRTKVHKYADSLGRYLTPQEIETVSGMSYTEYGELMRVGSSTIPSLDQLLPASDDTELGQLVGYDYMDRAIEAFSDAEELANIIGKAKLTDREKFVVGLRYGISPNMFDNPIIEVNGTSVSYSDIFNDVAIDTELDKVHANLTLEEVGELLGVTRERTRQIQKKAEGILATTARLQARSKRRDD